MPLRPSLVPGRRQRLGPQCFRSRRSPSSRRVVGCVCRRPPSAGTSRCGRFWVRLPRRSQRGAARAEAVGRMHLPRGSRRMEMGQERVVQVVRRRGRGSKNRPCSRSGRSLRKATRRAGVLRCSLLNDRTPWCCWEYKSVYAVEVAYVSMLHCLVTHYEQLARIKVASRMSVQDPSIIFRDLIFKSSVRRKVTHIATKGDRLAISSG